MGGKKCAAVVQRLVNPLGTVITIDPEHASTAPHGTPSVAPQPVADMIIVPAQSVSADNSSKVQHKVKTSIEVPHSKIAVNQTNTACSIKSSNLEVIDNKINEKDVLGVNKVVGKNSNSNKEKRKAAKKEKRNCDPVENNIRETDLISNKPKDSSESCLEPVNDISFESNAKPVDIKIVEKNVSVDKSKQGKKCNKVNKQPDDVLNPFDQTDVLLNEQELSIPLKSSCTESQLNNKLITDKIDDETCDPWCNKTFSDCLKTSTVPLFETDKAVTQNNIPDTPPEVVDEPEPGNCNILSSALCEKDNNLPKVTSVASAKTKRKCKTLGRKIKIEMPEKPVPPLTKLDEIDLLDSQVTKDSMLNEIPDLVLSNTNITETNEVVEENHEDDKSKLVSVCIEETLLELSEAKEETQAVVSEMDVPKSQNDETTDKDSSDDARNVEKSEVKCSEISVKQRKKKSTRKQKENESEVLSDSDNAVDKGNPPSQLNVAVKVSFESLENPMTVEEVKPKLSWSRIVSMGKQDANGNFSNIDSASQSESSLNNDSSSNTLVSIIGNDDKETSVKTNSAEDRGSVYESCSESVGEENQFEMAQQQSDVQEMVCDKTHSDNEALIDADIAIQNVDDDSLEKSNTDSGEKDSGDGNQSATKKSRKQRRKRR